MGLMKIPFIKDIIKKKTFFLTGEIKFDAAHRLSNYVGKCSRVHGHTYRVVVTVQSDGLNAWGGVMDFGDLKKILKTNIDEKYDHKTILQVGDPENQVLGRVLGQKGVCWMPNNPTAENMARSMYKDIKASLWRISQEVKLTSVTVFETATNAATYAEKL